MLHLSIKTPLKVIILKPALFIKHMIEVVFLGTSSMFPTRDRSHPAIFIRDGPENVLFDCGEGTQRQLRIAGISPMKINRIFITHWHGDHSLGLGGLIQSMSASNRTEKLEIYGPQSTTERIGHILRSFAFDLRFKLETHDIVIKDKKIQRIFENEQIAVESMPMEHIVPCLGFSFIEKGRIKIKIDVVKKLMGITQHPLLGQLQKGKTITFNGKKITPKQATYETPEKKVVYIADTSYFSELANFAKDADMLISEATYSEELETKALEYNHLTAKKSAEIAKKAEVKKLYLTHFSQRYNKMDLLLREAKKIFKNVELAEDFMKAAVI
jgi:ribonuclease Z